MKVDPEASVRIEGQAPEGFPEAKLLVPREAGIFFSGVDISAQCREEIRLDGPGPGDLFPCADIWRVGDGHDRTTIPCHIRAPRTPGFLSPTELSGRFIASRIHRQLPKKCCPDGSDGWDGCFLYPRASRGRPCWSPPDGSPHGSVRPLENGTAWADPSKMKRNRPNRPDRPAPGSDKEARRDREALGAELPGSRRAKQIHQSTDRQRQPDSAWQATGEIRIRPSGPSEPSGAFSPDRRAVRRAWSRGFTSFVLAPGLAWPRPARPAARASIVIMPLDPRFRPARGRRGRSR